MSTSSQPPPLLEARDLACERGERTLFEGLAMRVGPGEVLQARGPNGSGKTSLLRILCGLTEPAYGDVLWRGELVGPGAEDYFAEMAYVGHADGLKRQLTPRENLRASAAVRGAAGLDASAALERLGVAERADVPVRHLSAGQRRRVALARLLTIGAVLWVLDEPLNALDVAGIDLTWMLVDEHLASGGIAVLTSHLPVALGGAAPRVLDLS